MRQLLRRGLRYLRREASRPLPHGLLSWRYLGRPQDTRIRHHRQLWWHAPSHLPRPLWLLLELWLWLRWITFHAWRSTWLVVRTLGPEIRAREGLSLLQQARITLRLSLAWCIPPDQVYQFQLYKNSSAALDYVFDHETTAYHRLRSQSLGFTRASLLLLQDKQALFKNLGEAGLPITPTLACIARADSTEIQSWLKTDSKLFCKTRSGSGGIGAFSVWPTPEGPRGHMLNGKSLDSESDVDTAWQSLIRLDDVLIQPHLQNHPALQALCTDDGSISLRFISQINENGFDCLHAVLEIPFRGDEASKQTFYVFLPIKHDTGQLLAFPDSALITSNEEKSFGRVAKMLNPESVVPGWQEIVKHSYEAHRLFPDIREIAWDWVVTPEGPLLLEGNAGWGTETLQILNGGLLVAH